MKNQFKSYLLALGLAFLLTWGVTDAQEKKTRPEPPGPDPVEKKSGTQETSEGTKPAKSTENKAAKKAPARKGNWYIRQSPALLKALEPIGEMTKGNTVKVLANIKSRNKKETEGQVSLGTVIDSEGFIVTKASQIQSLVKSLKVEINGKKVPAKLHGIHEPSDLAMLKIETAGLELKPVQWQNQTPEVGYLLATPGVNSDIVGFGVLSVASREERDTRGFMGVQLRDPADKQKGALVTGVTQKSPAAYSGMRIGDIILKVENEAVENMQDLIGKVSKRKAGDTIKIKIRRDKKDLEKSIKLGDRSTYGVLQRLNPQETIAGNKLSRRRSGFDRVIQHDTVLKPEQMGGPIVDLDGRAIGLNIAKNGRVATYALPLSVIQPVLSELRSGKLAPAIINKPRIDQLTKLIAEKEKEIADNKLKENAEKAKKAFDDSAEAYEDAEKEYQKILKQLEEIGRKKFRADEKQKQARLQSKRAKDAFEDEQKKVDSFKKEKKELEDASK